MKYTAMLHYGLCRGTISKVPFGAEIVPHPCTVLHAKFFSEKEAVIWAEGLSNLPFVRGVQLRGKLTTPWNGSQSSSCIYFCRRELA